MKKYLVFLFLFISLAANSQIRARYDISEVTYVDDSTWTLSGVIVDPTGSYTALSVAAGDKIIQRGFAPTTGVTVYDRFIVISIISAMDNNTLSVTVRSDLDNVLNNTGGPLSGSFPIGSPVALSNLTLKPSWYQTEIDPDYDAGMDNLNLQEVLALAYDTSLYATKYDLDTLSHYRIPDTVNILLSQERGMHDFAPISHIQGLGTITGLQDSIDKHTDSLQGHRIKILAIYDSLLNIYTETQTNALLNLKANVSDTGYYLLDRTRASHEYIPLTQRAQNNGVATLDNGGKVPISQLPATLMIYQGLWNPATNTPTLSDNTGVSGWVYKCSVGGTVDLGSGDIAFLAGDFVIHNGTVWERSVGTDNVVSVNSQQGVVLLNTSHVADVTNYRYVTDSQRDSIKHTNRGLLNVLQDSLTDSWNKRDTSVLLSRLRALHDFQLKLTNPITGTGTTNYLSKFTGASTVGNSLIFDNGTNVGIGTTAPTVKLAIGTDLAINNSSYASIGNGSASSGLVVGQGSSNFAAFDWVYNATPANGYGRFSTQSYVNDFRIDANNVLLQAHGGNVGIGTTAPYYKLDVAGDARIQGPNKQYFGGTTGAGTDYFYSPSSGIIQTASQLKSTVATGTAPLTVASTTKVNKLNVANSDSLGLKPAAWYRALNNHDSLSALDEKSYNSLTDKPTAWAISAITDLQDTLDRHTDTAQSHNARINSLKTATIDSLINHNTRISNVTDTTQHHNTKILAIYDSLSHIYTESQIAALLLAKLNISDTANLATITEVNSRDTLTRTTLRSQFVNRDSLAKQGIRVEYVNHDSLDRTVLRGQFNNRDSLAKRGVRTEYINHDSLVKSSLRTEYKNHDSVAKQTIRTEYVNHDTIVKTSLRVEIKNHDSVGKQGIRVEYINHDTLDRTVLRGQFINRDSLAKQGIRIEYVNHDSLDRTVLRGQFVNRDSLDRTTLRSQFNNRDTLVRIYARDRDALRVPKTTTLTINGTGYDLSTNRSWTIADNNTTYSAGYRTQLSGITFNNTSHWQDQDSLNVSDGLVLATSKKLSVITNNSADWNEAHGWGNHASAGYLTSEVDGSTTNELQGISYVNRKLTISAGGGTPNTISLPRFSTTDTASGLVKGSANVGSTYFLNGAGNWAVPPDNNTTYDLSSYVQKGDTGIIAGNFATPFDLTHGLDGKAGVNQTMYLGTTGVAINRGSGSLSLAGVSIDGTSGGLAAQYIDWNSASGGNSIKNKPTIPAAEAYFGTVTSIATTSPLTGGTITSSGTIAIIADTLVQWRTKQNKGVVAYNWGNHADAGYLTSQTSHADVVVDGDFASNGLMKRTGAGTYGIVTDNSANWNKAYDSTSSPGWISKYKIDAAGDLIIGAGNNTYNRLAIGQDRKFARSNGTTVLWDTISDADATHRGLLTSTSYNLFYNKVSFPGFGTSHSTAAYGDHTHASSMTWPASAGIPLYSGSSSWGTSIPDSSDAWTTAYKWGNHAGAGYSVISATENITGEKTFTDGKLVMGGTKATILKSSASATNKTITFPNASGTVALTIDIPSLSNYVTLDGDQTISGAKSFNDNKLQINNPAGNGTTVFGTIAHSGTSKTITFPDASGTIALTSDIPTFSTAISGYVPHFTSATNIDTTRIFISGKNIGIGTTNPTVDLQLVSNTTLLEELDVYSNTATSKGGVFFRKAKGTIASPLSVSAGDQLGVLGFVGAYSVGGVGTFPTSAQGAIFAKAEENFTSATNLGTYLTFETTSSGSGTRTEKIRINGDGTIKIGATGSSYSLPSTNGNDDQVMISNGSDGTLTWSDVGDLIAPVIEPKFALGIDSTAINTIVKYPMGYSSGIVVDSIICIGTGTGTHTSGHAEAEIYYGSDMSATGTILNNGIYFCPNYDYNKADRYSGADLHNTTIAKGNIIWVKFHSVTTSPRMIYFQIIGHAISGVPAL